MKVKTIFLDIDGVLNHPEWMSKLDSTLRMTDEDWWIEMIDPSCVAHLNTIIDRTGATVIVSSTWRRNFDKEGLQRVLEAAGFRGKVTGKTTLEHMKRRGYQISEWLELGCGLLGNFVILDDLHPLEFDHLKDYHVWVDPKGKGLNENHARKAIELLERDEFLFGVPEDMHIHYLMDRGKK